MTAIQDENRKWLVVNGAKMLAGPFETSSEAWRWIDRYTGQPLNKSEKTAEWAWDRSVDRSFGA